jgi:Amt family ammonium transporter
MTIPGLALFYGGLVRSKNMLSVLMQVFVTFSLIVVLWVIYGYTPGLHRRQGRSSAGSTSCSSRASTPDVRWRATFSKGVVHPRADLFVAFQAHLRGHHLRR